METNPSDRKANQWLPEDEQLRGLGREFRKTKGKLLGVMDMCLLY